MATTQKSQTVEVEVTTRTLPHVQHKTLPEALAAFQAEVPTIRKTNEATVTSQKGSYKYAYADLADITEKALPLLGKHGLSFHSTPTIDENHGFILEYTLGHESSEAITGIYPLPDPRSTPPQSLGAAITYARRYVLCAVTGIAPGGDDEDAHTRDLPSAQTPVEPSRDWIAEANAAPDKDAVGRLWQELRVEVQQGRAPLALLDQVAAIGRARSAAENPTDEPTPAAEEAAE